MREKEKQVGQSAISGSAPLVDREDTLMETVVHQLFSPFYADANGKLVLMDDRVMADPGVVVTLLQGLALPKDMEQISKELTPSFVDMCSHLVQVFFALVAFLHVLLLSDLCNFFLFFRPAKLLSTLTGSLVSKVPRARTTETR